MRWTQEQLNAYVGRFAKLEEKYGQPKSSSEEPEKTLHGQISAYCDGRGWVAFHGSMAHKTWRTVGEPDWIILADAGRVFFIECKSATGKLTSEQLGMIAWAKRLGHEIHVVRDMKTFYEIVNQKHHETDR